MTPHASDHPAAEARRPWTVLAVLAVAQFMVILDITIVNVALPSIGRALSFPRSGLQWVLTAYVLCSGGLVLVGGRAADLFGRRRVFLVGLALFTAASLSSALAPSAGILIASRAAQGIGAAMLTPSALSIVSTVYSGSQLATALSIWGAIASAGIAVGVIFGGVLTTLLSWRWVFLVNVPVGVTAGLLAPRLIPAVPAAGRRGSLDPFGALSLVAGLAVLVYALSGAAAHGWGSARTVGLLALSVALLVAFAAIERTVAEPLIPPAIWRVTQVVSGAAIMLGATGILAGTFFLVSVHTQEVLGWSALHSGLALLPFVAATAVGVHGTSRADRQGRVARADRGGAGDRGGRRAGAGHRARPLLVRVGAAAGAGRARSGDGPGVPRDLDHDHERRRSRDRRAGLGRDVNRARGRGRARHGGAVGDRGQLELGRVLWQRVRGRGCDRRRAGAGGGGRRPGGQAAPGGEGERSLRPGLRPGLRPALRPPAAPVR